MQLTKLEIKGFKSFGDKVIINFGEGVTGIVGPNGCGKSNVVDSIRWVLGEQKISALRSEKMENIIFNGTKNRKPTQLAEVSLTFDNTKNLLPTEYNQITITRRYYRTGESEYLLNGVICRLKDINNLFLDTGIGPDNYAIIELKMVDNLLNDKDGSRRELFEEAAGISKFKVRKKETFRKLEDTDQDLERVDDLLYEINKNLKSLEKQAKQTEDYFKIKEEYKQLTIQLAQQSTHIQHEALQNLTHQITEEQDQKTRITTQLIEKEAGVEQLKIDLLNKEKSLSTHQKELNEHVNKIRTFEGEKQLKNERLKFLNDKATTLQELIDQGKKDNDQAEISIKSLKNEKGESEKITENSRLQLEKLKTEHDRQKTHTVDLQKKLVDLSSLLKTNQEQAYTLVKSIEISKMQLSSLQEEMEKTDSDNLNHSSAITELESKLHELTNQLEAKTKEVEQEQLLEEDLQNKIQDSESNFELIREEINQLTRKRDAIENEYNLTKSLVDNLEGFPEAIKFLKKNASWGKEAPLLSDIITCDERYRVTIENYLEPYMNYYIVEEEAHAYQAVNLLSEAAKGRAHFFILSSFDHFQSSPTKLFEHAIPASDIVEYDSKYKQLVRYLLDHVYILTSHYKDTPQDNEAIFISQGGNFIRKKFSLSGGSVGLFEGKRIGRAKNLEKLQEELQALTQKIELVKHSFNFNQEELRKLKENTQKEKIEKLQNELGVLRENYISIKTKHEQLSQFLINSSVKKEDIIEKINSITSEIEQQHPHVQSTTKEVNDLEHEINQLTLELEKENAILNEKSQHYNTENIHFHQQQNKTQSLQQEIDYKQSSWETTKERISKSAEELTQTELAITSHLISSEENENELINLYRQKEDLEKNVGEAEKEYYQHRGTIEHIEKEIRELLKRREQIDELIHEAENRTNEIKLTLTSLKERLSVEFNVNLEDILNQYTQDNTSLDEAKLKEEVEKTKAKLDRIGPINPMAMEAYTEIQQRNNFILEQKEDLIKAKESLLSTIQEIDQVAKETFVNAFEKIRENFINVFRSLFSEEDSCDLKLVDPDNPLESEIEISAKPKGKRPLTINQLSGGEKTLTAVSLLFSIYLLKPAPFCIFDEVDAPLDDANIDKFNTIIRKFSKGSQFIIVTHNKRTMVSTDVMYGITMVEQGISQVVPVDLRSLN